MTVTPIVVEIFAPDADEESSVIRMLTRRPAVSRMRPLHSFAADPLEMAEPAGKYGGGASGSVSGNAAARSSVRLGNRPRLRELRMQPSWVLH